MPTSNAEELRLFLKCTVIGRGVFGPCACWRGRRQLPKGVLQPIITVRNSSCGKVMFSQACVKNSVQGGACVAGGMHGKGGACVGCVAGDSPKAVPDPGFS